MPLTPIVNTPANDPGADNLTESFTKVNNNEAYLDGRINTTDSNVSGKQATLVSNTNIKTVNGTSLLGSGDIDATTDISGKQDTLVSATNIKTVNGETLLGAGDIEVVGGGATATITAPYPYAKIGIETLTGKRHPANDKPIYTQMFSRILNNDDVIVTGLTGVELCVVSHWQWEGTNGIAYSQGSSYYVSDAAEQRVMCKADGSEITPYTSDGDATFNGQTMYVAIEYAKTADTSSSPIAALEGSSEMPYTKVGEETLLSKRYPTSDKPVYSQSFFVADIGTTYDSTIVTGLTGIENIHIVDMITTRSDNNVLSTAYSFYNTDVNEHYAQMNGVDIDYYLSDHAVFNNSSLLFELEYTKTTDTSLSPIAKVYNSQTSAEVALMPDYSTNETLTTERWTDGKPIYRKVINHNFAAISTSTFTNIGTNVGDICSHELVVTDANGDITGGEAYIETSTGVNHYFIIINSAKQIQSYAYNALWANQLIVSTVLYTKTIDTGSSPVAGIGQTSGSVLQVLTATAATTQVANSNYLDITFTPKSSNSKIIFEFFGNVYIDAAGEELSVFAQIDTVDVGALFANVYTPTGGIGIGWPIIGMEEYTNTDLVTKTARVRSAIVGTPASNGSASLKITEVQN